MKVNLDIPFRNFQGEPICENGKEVTMAEFVGKALFGFGQGGQQTLEQSEMIRAYDIIRKLQTSPSEVSLSSEDITFIKDKMAKVLTVGCYGQLYMILEQEN